MRSEVSLQFELLPELTIKGGAQEHSKRNAF
jgi:hypothetical protein